MNIWICLVIILLLIASSVGGYFVYTSRATGTPPAEQTPPVAT